MPQRSSGVKVLTIVAAFLALVPVPRAGAQETAPSCCGREFVVTGVEGHFALPAGASVSGADSAEKADTFADQVWGHELLATVPGLEAGEYTVDIDVAELFCRAKGRRVVEISCGGLTLAKDFDCFDAAGGFARAYRLTAKVSHQADAVGGPLAIKFTGKVDHATFNAIHVKDAAGKGVACVTAKDLRPLEVPGADLVPDVAGPVKYTDPSLPAEARAADLVSRMTLREKVAQMSNRAPAIARLDVPAYDYWNECLHGVARAGEATVFPQAIGMAASWDPGLLYDVADAISTEARAKHRQALAHGGRGEYQGLTFWTPNINIFRDPRWGRGQETYGEDPFLTGTMAVQFIKGLQGDDPRYLKVVATAKHFAVHSGPESQRHKFDVSPGERDLYETYLPQFEAAVREAGVSSVMGAYNAVFGEPCCSSDFLLGKVLRGEWGFKGYVVSDCGAITDIYNGHHRVPGKAQAAARAVKAGCDLECGGDYSALTQAVGEGLLTSADLDTAVARLFTARFRLGMFDPDDRVPYARTPVEENCSPAHAALALRAAAESLVLLKNDGVLPLDRGRVHKLAVVGPNVDTITAFYGNYNGVPATCPTLLEGLRAKLGAGVEIIPVMGCSYAASPGAMELVPDVCLRHDGRPGLKAEYFTNRDLSGEPAVVRDDLAVDFCYYYTAHLPAYPSANTSARWTGELVAPEAGDYTLAVDTKEPVRLWVDGKPLIDRWAVASRPATNRSAPPEAKGVVHLEKGQAAALRLEYAHTDRTARCALMWDHKAWDPTPLVVDRVAGADAILFAGGINGDVESEEGSAHRAMVGFDGDRAAIELPAVQEKLAEALAATGKPVVFLNFSGSAMAMPWEAEHLGAVVQAWYPGQAAAAAVADAVFGDAAPAGRLPVTFYRATTDLPDFTDYAMKGRTYRYFPGKPLWAFGRGLTYTTFAYDHLAPGKDAFAKTDHASVSLDVANTGPRDGEEVVQLYVRRPNDPDGPRRDLRAFQRVAVSRGQTRRVTLSLPVASLRRWDTDRHAYVVDAGVYDVEVGAASDDIRLTGKIKVVD